MIEDPHQHRKLLMSLDKDLKLPLTTHLLREVASSHNASTQFVSNSDNIYYGRSIKGHGTMTLKTGPSYQGKLYKGLRHGRGVLIYPDSQVEIRTHFQYNQACGKATVLFPLERAEYSGELLYGLRHGQGTFTSIEHNFSYTGSWKYDLKHGKGILKYPNNSIFEGDFKDNHKDGQGQITFPSGNYYRGQYSQDRKSGYGEMYWLPEEVYKGFWEDNRQQGIGQHIWMEESSIRSEWTTRYEGQWNDGARNGLGIFYYSDGSCYIGEWKDNFKHGYGQIIGIFGNIIETVFEKDKCIKVLNNPHEKIAKLVGDGLDMSGLEDDKELIKTLENSMRGTFPSTKSRQSRLLRKTRGSGSSRVNRIKSSKKSLGVTKKWGQQTASNVASRFGTTYNTNLIMSIDGLSTGRLQINKVIDPYQHILDSSFFGSLEIGTTPFNEFQKKRIRNTVLRKNSELLKVYRILKTRIFRTDQLFESLDQKSLIEFFKRAGLFTLRVNPSNFIVNFYQNDKNLILKNFDLQAVSDIVQTIKRKYSEENKLLIRLKTSEQQQQQQDKLGFRQRRVEEEDNVILFRNFVDSIVRLAYLRVLKGQDSNNRDNLEGDHSKSKTENIISEFDSIVDTIIDKVDENEKAVIDYELVDSFKNGFGVESGGLVPLKQILVYLKQLGVDIKLVQVIEALKLDSGNNGQIDDDEEGVRVLLGSKVNGADFERLVKSISQNLDDVSPYNYMIFSNPYQEERQQGGF